MSSGERDEAWWAAWELATTATVAYERGGRETDAETALAALRGWKFPNGSDLHARLRAAREAHRQSA
jgi:hypothetical protein